MPPIPYIITTERQIRHPGMCEQEYKNNCTYKRKGELRRGTMLKIEGEDIFSKQYTWNCTSKLIPQEKGDITGSVSHHCVDICTCEGTLDFPLNLKDFKVAETEIREISKPDGLYKDSEDVKKYILDHTVPWIMEDVWRDMCETLARGGIAVPPEWKRLNGSIQEEVARIGNNFLRTSIGLKDFWPKLIDQVKGKVKVELYFDQDTLFISLPISQKDQVIQAERMMNALFPSGAKVKVKESNSVDVIGEEAGVPYTYKIGKIVKFEVTTLSRGLVSYATKYVPTKIHTSRKFCDQITKDLGTMSVACYNLLCRTDPTADCDEIMEKSCKKNSDRYGDRDVLIVSGSDQCNCVNGAFWTWTGSPDKVMDQCFSRRCVQGTYIPERVTDQVCKDKCDDMISKLGSEKVSSIPIIVQKRYLDVKKLKRLCEYDYVIPEDTKDPKEKEREKKTPVHKRLWLYVLAGLALLAIIIVAVLMARK